MKVVLYYPRNFDNSSGKADISTLAVTLPPLGLVTIAAVLRDAGHDVVIMDASLNYNIKDSEWVKKIIAEEPDFVGFSTITPNFLYAYRICQGVKEKNSSIKTVFGGVHVSWGMDRILKSYEHVDFVVVGEGEFAFRDIISGKNPKEIAGVFSRGENRILSGPIQSKETLCKMDDIPFPAYDLVEGFPKKYNMALFSYPKHPGANIISSRGCVYNCSYCDRSVFHNSFRWNSPEYTYELMKYLNRDFGIKHFMFYDDLFTLNRNRVSKLCTLLREGDLNISFNCIVRIGHIDSDLIAELKSAGGWMVHVGVESGDQDMLDSHKDGLTLEAITRDVNKLHNSGLWVKGLFMMGFPGETLKTIQKTIDFAASLPLKDANITAFTPYAGSPIAANIDKYGIFDASPENWENMDCVKFVFLNNEIINEVGLENAKATLEAQYGKFLSTFYNRKFMHKVYRQMMIQSPHSFWRLLKNSPTFLKYAMNMK